MQCDLAGSGCVSPHTVANAAGFRRMWLLSRHTVGNVAGVELPELGHCPPHPVSAITLVIIVTTSNRRYVQEDMAGFSAASLHSLDIVLRTWTGCCRCRLASPRSPGLL